MEMLFLLLGIIIGGIVAFFALGMKQKNTEAKLMLANQLSEQALMRENEQKCRVEALNKEMEQLRNELTQNKMELQKAITQLEAERTQNSNETKLRNEQFNQQLTTVQEQFSNLAHKVLQQTSDQLKTSSQDTFESLTKPLKINLEQLNQAIQNTNSETAKSTASLSEQLRAMSEQTSKIDATANRLTNVIRGGNKTQGNWGERMLTDILDAQGLVCGRDYDVQQTITDQKGMAITHDESGKRMIPDVILHYPNNEDVVIDSKMSIEAYYQYVNTEDETLKKKYADDLVKSIRTQMSGLAKKDYSSYIKAPRHAIDFVIMFVPNEGALQLALTHDPKLWGEAFERQVFVTSQQNLMAILKIIQVAWRQYAQTENQKKVYGMAEELLKRVGEFLKRFDKVGHDIETLHKDYDEAYKKALTGRQSIAQKANEMKELGVKEAANQPIPPTEPDLIDL